MIRKVKGGYKVTAESGRALSRVLTTYKQARKRLAQVEMFKHMKK